MLILTFHGGSPYLSTEKGAVGFVEKMELRLGKGCFEVAKFVVVKSAFMGNLNEGEKRHVEVSP